MRRNFRGLGFEKLEGRDLLAGGAIVGGYPTIPPELSASVFANSLPVPELRIIPSSVEARLAEFGFNTVPGSHTFAQIPVGSQFVLVPSPGSSLSQDIQGFELRVDPNNDGIYDKVIGSGSPNSGSGLGIISISQGVWFGDEPMKVVVVANFNSSFSGSSVGVGLAGVFGLKDLGGADILANTVYYAGVSPVVHTLSSESYVVAQNYRELPFQSVSAGQNVTKLVEFQGWGRTSALTGITLDVTNPGNLVSDSLSLVVDKNWDGNGDVSTVGTMTVVGENTSQVSFVLPGAGVSGSANFWVSGLTAQYASVVDATFKLGFTDKVTATSNATGEPLQGVVFNGNGVGQTKVYTNNVTTFALIENPQLVVSDGGPAVTNPQPQYVDYSQEVGVATFDIKNTGVSVASVDEIWLGAKRGDLRACDVSTYVLFEVNSATGEKTQVSAGIPVQGATAFAIVFPTAISVPTNTTQFYEVRAMTVAIDAPYISVSLQAAIDPFAFRAIEDGHTLNPMRDIYYTLGDNPFLSIIATVGGGLG